MPVSLASGAHPAATFANSHLLRPVVATRENVSTAQVAWAAPKAGCAITELREAVHDEDWGKNFSEGLTKIHMRSEWSASDERCSFFQWLLFSTQARHVLEIGSFCGVGTLALAEALPQGGEVTALELDPFVVNLGKRFQMKSEAAERIHHMIGPAKESIIQIARDSLSGKRSPFDVIVVDADKENMEHYFDVVSCSPDLLREGGVICVDMTPFKGQPPLRYLKYGFPYRCEANSGQEQIDALRAKVKASPHFAAYEFGGLMIVQKKSEAEPSKRCPWERANTL
eukprot:TRINITY_DN18579_c0_g1_i1.p1 TRINITY_DN18579_c0_g1~~TRINITY_DN18579_c0_g1_i1.p1  ORF type:complete len:284 (+),score=61.98 TRINITY_DN18579_c0_g1_i1:95-946(+)